MMSAIPMGLQLYSIRQECARDLPGSLKAVKEMGYDGVEFAGYYDYTAKNLRKLLDDNGLTCCGTHTSLASLLDDELPRTIEFNQTLGNLYLIVPWLAEKYRDSSAAWMETAQQFNRVADQLKPLGMYAGYHNHDIEFQPIAGGVPFDLFFANTQPRVIMQADLGNAMIGGGDPLACLRRYPGRAITIHLKEYCAKNPKALIGDGDVDWPEVFHLCETTGGTQWYIVEYESDAYPPLESVARCRANLRKMGK
jgi:sugar phosphate isomerase/epimerase